MFGVGRQELHFTLKSCIDPTVSTAAAGTRESSALVRWLARMDEKAMEHIEKLSCSSRQSQERGGSGGGGGSHENVPHWLGSCDSLAVSSPSSLLSQRLTEAFFHLVCKWFALLGHSHDGLNTLLDIADELASAQ